MTYYPSSIVISDSSAGNGALVQLGITRAQIPNYVITSSRFLTSDGAPWVPGTSAGLLAIRDASGAWWQLDTSVASFWVHWFGADVTGATSSSTAFASALTAARTYGVKLRAKGAFTFSANVLCTLAAGQNLDFEAETGTTFTASPGFPHNRLFLINGGDATSTVQWKGGYYLGANIPNSLTGEANDVIDFAMGTTSGPPIFELKVSDLHIDCGGNWLTSGSDSCMFAANATHISVERCRFSGAPDCGLYLSGGSYNDGTANFLERVHLDDITCDLCLTGVIIKRCSRRIHVGRITIDNCPNGVVVGSSALLGDTTINNVTEDAFIESVIGRYCEQLMIIRNITNVHVDSVISRFAGSYITTGGGYSSGTAIATYVQGAKRCTVVSSICDRQNPSLGAINVYNVRVQDRTTNSTTVHSTNNAFLSIISNTIYRSFNEDDANQDYNYAMVASEASVTSAPVKAGANSTVMLLNSATGTVDLKTAALRVAGNVYSSNASYLIRTNTTLTDSAAGNTATMTNAPTAGNPTKWIAIDDNGVSRKIPAW